MRMLRRGRGLGAAIPAGVRLLLVAGALAGAAAQSQAQADDERARRIASGTCSLCHGAQGETSTELYPRLAGQHQAYIARQLADFKSGRRSSKTMQEMAARLTSEEMAALGRYFERQEPVREGGADTAAALAGRAIYDGGIPARSLQPCASCHGPDAAGAAGLPRLAGQRAAYTVRQLKAYADRSRQADDGAMNTIAAALQPAEMEALAAFLASR